jgi:hypothetical protein
MCEGMEGERGKRRKKKKKENEERRGKREGSGDRREQQKYAVVGRSDEIYCAILAQIKKGRAGAIGAVADKIKCPK